MHIIGCDFHTRFSADCNDGFPDRRDHPSADWTTRQAKHGSFTQHFRLRPASEWKPRGAHSGLNGCWPRKGTSLGLARLNRELIGKAEAIESPYRAVLDMNSTEIPAYGEQEQSAYNGHFESTCSSSRAAPAARRADVLTLVGRNEALASSVVRKRRLRDQFSSKFRDEYLSLQWFRNRVDAKVGIEQWRRHYNDVRPHSSLGYLTPAEFKAQLRAGSDDGGRSPAMPAHADQEEHESDLTMPTGAVLQ